MAAATHPQSPTAREIAAMRKAVDMDIAAPEAWLREMFAPPTWLLVELVRVANSRGRAPWSTLDSRTMGAAAGRLRWDLACPAWVYLEPKVFAIYLHEVER